MIQVLLRRSSVVSLHRPHVRPIVRGKTTVKTVFGAKLTVSLVEGYAEVTTLSWDAYNESQDLVKAAEAYKARDGHYSRWIMADKIFRTRHNCLYCQSRCIHLDDPPLGRPPKVRTVYDEQLHLEREESRKRNAIEGKFGKGRCRHSLRLVKTKLQETSETKIHLLFLVMNLQKILRDHFYLHFLHTIFRKKMEKYWLCQHDKIQIADLFSETYDNRDFVNSSKMIRRLSISYDMMTAKKSDSYQFKWRFFWIIQYFSLWHQGAEASNSSNESVFKGEKIMDYDKKPGTHHKTCSTEIYQHLMNHNALCCPTWKPMHMQPICRMHPFVTVEGNGRVRTNAYIAGNSVDVGADIFARGLCFTSDNKMTPEDQDVIIEIIHRCFL